jgi:hypothetical protein
VRWMEKANLKDLDVDEVAGPMKLHLFESTHPTEEQGEPRTILHSGEHDALHELVAYG